VAADRGIGLKRSVHEAMKHPRDVVFIAKGGFKDGYPKESGTFSRNPDSRRKDGGTFTKSKKRGGRGGFGFDAG
jgi:hypothetical protein